MSEVAKGKLYIIFSAMIFGLMPLGASVAYRGGSNALQLVFWRLIIVIPLYWLLARKQGQRLKMKKKQFLQVQLLSLGFSITPVTLYMSYYYIDSGVATTLHFMYPLFVILGCWVFYKEKPGLKMWLCLGLTLTGLFMNMPRENAQSMGILLALVSALTFSFYVVYLAKSGLKSLGSMALLFHISIAGSIQTGLLATLFHSWTPMNSLGIAASIVFAIIVSFGAMYFQRGTFLIGPQRAAIFSTLEPLTSIVVGLVFLGDYITWFSGAGLVLILLSSLILSLE